MISEKPRDACQRLWLIDLDDTIHSTGGEIMNRINLLMTEYIKFSLNMSSVESSNLRIKYWKKYGATSAGLIKNHKIDLVNFLEYSHNVEGLSNLVTYKHGLRNKFSSLKGMKWILTNSYGEYAKKVLKVCNLINSFEKIISIENMRELGAIRPKPSLLLWEKILKNFKFKKLKVIVVDDSLINLKSAKIAGFVTVWVTSFRLLKNREKKLVIKPPYVDFKINRVDELLNINKKIKN